MSSTVRGKRRRNKRINYRGPPPSNSKPSPTNVHVEVNRSSLDASTNKEEEALLDRMMRAESLAAEEDGMPVFERPLEGKQPTSEHHSELNVPPELEMGEEFQKEFTMRNKLLDENTSLRSELNEQKERVGDLEEAILILQQEVELSQTSDIHAVSKDLARKNRALHLQITQLNAQNGRLTAQLEDSQKHTQELEDKIAALQATEQQRQRAVKDAVRRDRQSTTDTVLDGNNNDTETQLAIVTDRNRRLQSRTTALRQKIAAASEREAKLMKVLSRECGEKCDLESVIGASVQQQGAWRGRAEQIALLRSQVTTLKRIVADLKRKLGAKSGPESPDVTQERKRQRQSSTQEASKLLRIRELETALNESQERVSAQATSLKAQKARSASLRGQFLQAKKAADALKSKSQLDDQIIDRLKAEVIRLNKKVDTVISFSGNNKENVPSGGQNDSLLRKNRELERLIVSLQRRLSQQHEKTGASEVKKTSMNGTQEAEEQALLNILERAEERARVENGVADDGFVSIAPSR